MSMILSVMTKPSHTRHIIPVSSISGWPKPLFKSQTMTHPTATPLLHTPIPALLMSPPFLVSLIILYVWHICQLHLPCNFQTPVWFQVYMNMHLPPCNILWAFSAWASLFKSCPPMSLSPHLCLWSLLCLEFSPFWSLVLVFLRIFLSDAKAVG